jgi:TetR/AcrR family transcriptional regulator, repressor of fatR-cypB operon
MVIPMPPSSPRTDELESRREAIYGAALTLFATQGFDGTAVPEIAKRASVGAGTIYRHFDSKEGLVNALYRREKARLMTHLVEHFPWQSPPRSQFRAFFFRLAGFARREPLAFAFLEHHHHAHYLDAASRKAERNSLAPVRAFLDQGKARGELKHLPSEALAAMVWGMLAGVIKAESNGELTFTDELLADIEACAWEAIAAPPGNPSGPDVVEAELVKP